MNTTLAAARPAQTDRRPLGLRALAVAALVGIALIYIFVQAVLLGKVEMPLPIFVLVSLLLAALVAGRPVGGWRWTPILATLWSLILGAGSLGRMLLHLAHPEDTLTFAAQLVLLATLATGIVAGIGATVQNYRLPAAERRMPRWVRWGAVAVASLIVGGVAVAAIPQTSGAQVDPATLAQLPGVPLSAFENGEIRVRAGQLTALRLENPSAAGHSFDVDELGLHIAMPAGENSVALFTAPAPGTYTFYCAPHYDKASGQGMRGTLIVEP